MDINAEKIRMPASKVCLTQIVQDVRNFLGRKRIDFMQDLLYIMLLAEMASTKNIEKFASKMYRDRAQICNTNIMQTGGKDSAK